MNIKCQSIISKMHLVMNNRPCRSQGFKVRGTQEVFTENDTPSPGKFAM